MPSATAAHDLPGNCHTFQPHAAYTAHTLCLARLLIVLIHYSGTRSSSYSVMRRSVGGHSPRHQRCIEHCCGKSHRCIHVSTGDLPQCPAGSCRSAGPPGGPNIVFSREHKKRGSNGNGRGAVELRLKERFGRRRGQIRCVKHSRLTEIVSASMGIVSAVRVHGRMSAAILRRFCFCPKGCSTFQQSRRNLQASSRHSQNGRIKLANPNQAPHLGRRQKNSDHLSSINGRNKTLHGLHPWRRFFGVDLGELLAE